MKNLIYLLLIPIALVSCKPAEEGYKLSTRAAANLNTIEGDDDHQDPGAIPLNNLSVSSQALVKTEIYDEKDINVTISAAADFIGGQVNLSIDRSALDSDPINAGQNITITLSETSFDLSAGEQKQVMAKVKVDSMAPSFQSKMNGGQGEFKIIASSSEGSNSYTVSLGVDAIITLKFLDPGVYGIGADMIPDDSVVNIRPHEGGIELRSFYAKEFNQAYIDGSGQPGPCMHINGGGGITHCNTGADFETVGDSFSHGRVMPNVNKTTPFYDHNLRAGYTGTLNFNVQP